MIYQLKGTVEQISDGFVVLMTPGGVGYQLFLSTSTLTNCNIGEEKSFLTYLKVSDTAMQLFGFNSAAERKFFELLLSVKSVGPKSAMNILSLGSMEDIQGAIARGDAKYLTAVQGMGKKTAERLIVELKSKVGFIAGEMMSHEAGTPIAEVVEALEAMGYTSVEVQETLKAIDTNDMSTEELLKIALRSLSSTK